MIVGIILATILVPLICAGIVADVMNNRLAEELSILPGKAREEWRKNKSLPSRDNRNDGAFGDGMITGVMLDDLEGMFK